MWYIQDTHVSLHTLEQTAIALDNLDIDFEGFGVKPGVPTNIDFAYSEGNVIRSSLKVLRDSFNDEELFNNMFYTIDKFDQSEFMDILPMINQTGEISKYNDIEFKTFDMDMFIKPSSDIKLFAGMILKKGTSLYDTVFNTEVNEIYWEGTNPNILIAPLRNDLYEEYRLSVVNGEVVHTSKYLTQGKLTTSGNVPSDIVKACYKYISKYEPHDIFVIDLCRTSKGIEVVELNCWNCSGIYNWETVGYMFKKINEYVN